MKIEFSSFSLLILIHAIYYVWVLNFIECCVQNLNYKFLLSWIVKWRKEKEKAFIILHCTIVLFILKPPPPLLLHTVSFSCLQIFFSSMLENMFREVIIRRLFATRRWCAKGFALSCFQFITQREGKFLLDDVRWIEITCKCFVSFCAQKNCTFSRWIE